MAKRQKTDLDSLCDQIREFDFVPGLHKDSYRNILDCGLRGKNLPLAAIAADLLLQEHPSTLRGVFYRVVSAGVLPSTDKQHYRRLGRVMTKLREAGIVPFSWIVDNMRSTNKPSSWSGLADFTETVRNAYRLDFWERLSVEPSQS